MATAGDSGVSGAAAGTTALSLEQLREYLLAWGIPESRLEKRSRQLKQFDVTLVSLAAQPLNVLQALLIDQGEESTLVHMYDANTIKEGVLKAAAGVGAGAGIGAAAAITVSVVLPVDGADEDKDQEAESAEEELECSLESQDEVKELLAKVDAVGFLPLPARGTVPEDELNIPLDRKLRTRLHELQDFGRYFAQPARGGLSKLRKTVGKLDNRSENQARAREAQLQTSIMKYAPFLLSWPGFLCKISEEAHQVKVPGESKSLEFDAAVKVVHTFLGTAYILGEVKASTSGTGDVSKLVKKVEKAAAVPPFVGHVVRPAFMVDHAGPTAMRELDRVCRSRRVIRMVPGTGSIVPAALAAKASYKLSAWW